MQDKELAHNIMSMSVNFLGNTSGLQGAIGVAKKALTDLSSGNWSGAAMTGIAAIGGAAIGFGVASVKAAADFQTAMSKVQAYCGLTKHQTDDLGNSVLSLAASMGQSPKAMADALYPIMSSGYSASQALNILKLSAMTASASGANMATIADALTSSLKAMGAPASQAGNYMDMINKIVAEGKGTVPQYAMVIGKLSLAASGAHIPFADMGAALATLTTHGFPSVAQASTGLSNLFTQIGPKVDALATHAKKLGLTFDESRFKTDNLSQKLAYMQEVTHGNQGELLKLVGGSVVALRAFNSLHNAAGDYTSNLNAMKNAQGTTASVFATTYGDWNNSVARMSATFQVLLVQVGQKLLPVLSSMLNSVTPLISQFASWITTMGGAGSVLGGFTPILANIQGMIHVMAYNWMSFGQTIQSILGGPLQQFGTTMGQLLPGFISQFLRIFLDVQLLFQDVAGTVATVVAPALGVVGEVFKNAQGVIEHVVTTLENQFLPAIHNLITAVAPVIAGILTWIQTSGVLPIIFNVLSTAISFVIGTISVLVNIIASLIVFFSQTDVGIAIFRATLIVLGVVLGTIGIIILTTVIPAFIAWVAGAIAVGIANVIAFAPIILIVLAVIAVVAIVVLVIMKWGVIANWLQGVWAAFSGWFMGALHAIGAFFVGVWNGIIVGLQNAWNFIITVVKIGILTVLVIMFAPIIAIVALFFWLYNHNYYFKDLVDKIIGFIKGCVAWLVSAWHNVINWIVGAWQWLSAMSMMVWSAIVGFIQAQVSRAANFLQSIWTNVVGFLGNIWNKISQGVSQMWSAIGGFFANAWSSYIVHPLQSLWNNILSFVGGWPAQAVQWGINLIQGFINGITSMIGNVGSAIGNVANTVKNFLGFHSPSKEGPGRELDIWGPNLIKGFASGIQKGIPMVQAAVNMAIKPVKDGFNYPQNTRPGQGNGGGANGGGGNNQPVIFTVEMDGKEIARKVAPQIVGHMRLQAGVRA